MNRMNGTRFLHQEELAKELAELDMGAESYPTGGIPLLVKNHKIYVDAADSHTMIFGATGSKKTRMFAMPSIGIFARAGESFVATDPKGELYKRTIGDVTEHRYQIYCLNLRNFREGVTWNPLALPYKYYHNGKKSKAVEVVSEMATMIIGLDATEEVFWTNTAIDVFCGFTLLLFESATASECHLRSLIELWNLYLKNRKKVMERIREQYGDTLIYQKVASLDNTSEKTVGSIEAFITMGLNKLSINEEFVTFLSQTGMDLEAAAEEKTAIYLVIPDENRSYHFVASLFLEQLYEVLIQKAQNEKEQKLPIRMNFLIDEFANIPKIENMDSMITAARSRNIRFHLVVQGMKQLRQKYEEGAEIIRGNCNNWVYLYSKEYELLQEISRLCGEVIYDNHLRMPLFSEFDLQHLNKEEGEALVLAGRNCPCISNLADIEQYPFPAFESVKTVYQEWKPLKVYDPSGKRKDNYCCQIGGKNIGRILKFHEPYRWLVAVEPNGMIMEEALYRKDDIKSGIAIGEMAYRILNEKGFEIENLEWYSAEEVVRGRYYRRLKNEPEKVYMTLEEIEKSSFQKEEGLKIAYKKNLIYDDFYISAQKCKRGEKKWKVEEESILMQKVRAYDGMLGKQYLYNQIFRLVNMQIKGEAYEAIPWEYNGSYENEQEDCERERTESFKKELNDSEWITVSVYRRPNGW